MTDLLFYKSIYTHTTRRIWRRAVLLTYFFILSYFSSNNARRGSGEKKTPGANFLFNKELKCNFFLYFCGAH